MNNKNLRNSICIILDILFIIDTLYIAYYCISQALSAFNWWLLGGLILLLPLIYNIAKRLRVINVCPNCQQNRGIYETVEPTGRKRNYSQFIRGDYHYTSWEAEYNHIVKCYYCNYEISGTSWSYEEQRGEITQEAQSRIEHEQRIREVQEAARAQEEAYDNAFRKHRMQEHEDRLWGRY